MDATLLLRHWAWVGWGGILTFMYLAYIRGCYAAANFWNTWKTSCRRIDAVRWGKKEANPGIDKVVTSFQKNIKIIVSLRRKRHFANFPMEFSHKKCIHLKLEKSPYKRTENQCWMILNLHFEPRPSMRRVPSWCGKNLSCRFALDINQSSSLSQTPKQIDGNGQQKSERTGRPQGRFFPACCPLRNWCW